MRVKSRKVVLVMVDSQRYDMLNCYRNTGLATPNLDRLAQEGTRFEYAYTAQPVCGPARSCIFTGQYPHSVNGWTNGMALAENVHTVGERLADLGIHTAYIGKWHLDGSDYFGLGRAAKGWDPDCWYDMRNFMEELTEQERRDSRQSAKMFEKDFKAEDTFAHRVSSRAVKFLKEHGEEDFFLTVSYDEPHDPAICPREFWQKYTDYSFPVSGNIWDDLSGKPDYQQIWNAGIRKYIPDVPKEQFRIPIPGMAGCNEFVDYEIGRVLEAVDKYAEDAVVIYTSDHGELLLSHGMVGKGPVIYDECTRIPFIIKGPGVRAGAVDSNPVSHINITPTVFELMGIPVPKIIEGKSLVPELEDPGKRVNEYVFIEFGRYENDQDGYGGLQLMRGVFDGRYKLAVNLLSTDELYDLKEDPQEMHNLIECGEYASVRDRLHDAVLENMNLTRDPFRGYYWECRPWRKDAVRPSWAYTGLKRQREEDPGYEERQLDYATGMPIETASAADGFNM